MCGPVLLLQGDADTYVPASDTDALWNDICNTSDKTYVTFEGMEHNVMYVESTTADMFLFVGCRGQLPWGAGRACVRGLWFVGGWFTRRPSCVRARYEPGCEMVMEVIGEWIEARLPMRKTAESTSGKDIGGRYSLRPSRTKDHEKQRNDPKHVADLQARIFDRDSRLAALSQRMEVEMQRQQDLRSRIKARLSSGRPVYDDVATSTTTTSHRAAGDSDDAKYGAAEFDDLVSEEARLTAELLSLTKQAEAARSKNQRLKEQLRGTMQQRQQQQPHETANNNAAAERRKAW